MVKSEPTYENNLFRVFRYRKGGSPVIELKAQAGTWAPEQVVMAKALARTLYGSLPDNAFIWTNTQPHPYVRISIMGDV